MQRQLWIAVALIAGCGAGTQYFEPSERVQGQTVHGHKVAIYPLTGPSGVFGEAKVWSSGAHRTDDERAVVRVGFEIHNTSATPIELRTNELRLDVLPFAGNPIKDLMASQPSSRVIAPGAIGEASLKFELPADLSPGDVSALRLRWSVHNGPQSYVQRTPFIEEVQAPYPPGYASYPCWPYGPYDCTFVHGYGYYGHYHHDPFLYPRGGRGPRTAVRP
jgi:hypothetical protein